MYLEKDKIYEVYITKYALTNGIEKRKLTYTGISEMMVDKDFNSMYYHGEGKDWHIMLKNAIKKAKKMRQRKIISLEKQLRNVENIIF